MAHPISIKYLIFFLMTGLLTSCYDVDYTGFFMRSEKANQRFTESMEWNALNPYRQIVTDSDDYLLLVMGDSHVGGTKNLLHFFDIARDLEPEALVMAGDLVTGREEDYQLFYDALPDREEVLWFPVVGNHDLYFDGWTHFYDLFGASVYLFTIKTPNATDLMIVLDTGSGTLGSKQLEWLSGKLDNIRDDYRYCMLFTHNNLFRDPPTWSTNPPVEELHVLMDLFLRHSVDFFIAGHDHRRNETHFGNTTYLLVDALKDGLSNAGYLMLNVTDASVDYRFEYLWDH